MRKAKKRNREDKKSAARVGQIKISQGMIKRYFDEDTNRTGRNSAEGMEEPRLCIQLRCAQVILTDVPVCVKQLRKG